MSLAIESKPGFSASMLTCYVPRHARYSLIALSFIPFQAGFVNRNTEFRPKKRHPPPSKRNTFRRTRLARTSRKNAAHRRRPSSSQGPPQQSAAPALSRSDLLHGIFGTFFTYFSHRRGALCIHHRNPVGSRRFFCADPRFFLAQATKEMYNICVKIQPKTLNVMEA